MKAVVTGAAGFIGSHIAEALISSGYYVVCIDDMTAGAWNNFVPWYSGDRCAMFPLDVSAASNDELCDAMEDSEAVFHNAASKCTVCRNDPKRDLVVNAWGAFRIATAAARMGSKMIHASTGSVYGAASLHEEGSQYAPKSFYGVSKLAGEQYLRSVAEYSPGFRWVALRYFHVFGPRQNAGPDGGVVAIFVSKILRGEPITVYGDGEQTRTFTYVKDVVRANMLAADSGRMEGRAFNVSAGVPRTLNNLIRDIEEITGRKAIVRHEPSRAGDIREFTVANYRLEDAGFRGWTPWMDALAETVEWYGAQAK